jgi:hypothetical protein
MRFTWLPKAASKAVSPGPSDLGFCVESPGFGRMLCCRVSRLRYLEAADASQRRHRWQNEPEGDFDSGYVARAAAVLLSEMVRSASNRRSAEKGVPVGTKTVTMYVSDLDQSEIPAGQAYQLSIRHPDGSTQQLDISEQNYRDLKLAGVGKTLKKRGRKPGSTTTADSTPRKRRRRQTSEPPVTA